MIMPVPYMLHNDDPKTVLPLASANIVIMTTRGGNPFRITGFSLQRLGVFFDFSLNMVLR